jgi:hypothetical protein
VSLSCSDRTRLRPTPRPKPSQIPGLVEAILLQLLLRDLLRTQRVCHLWKATTEQSSILQRKLFFQPASDPDQRPEFNPLLEAGFSLLFRLNQEEWKASAFYEAADWYYKDEALQQALLRPEASWRRMSPTQPPAKIGTVASVGGCGAFFTNVEGVIRDSFQERSATMGLLWDLVMHLIDSGPYSTVQWHMLNSEGGTEKAKKVRSVRNTVSINHSWSTDYSSFRLMVALAD